MNPRLLRLLPLLLSFGHALGETAPPALTVELGEVNQGGGLEVPNAGDGANVPVQVNGAAARRVSGERAIYLYVAVKGLGAGPKDLYVTAEAADDLFTRLTLQYDKAAAKPDLATKYSPSPEVAYLTGQGGWRTMTFSLPAARLGHGENSGADFRLEAPGVAFRRITVSSERPAGFGAQAIDPGTLKALEVRRPPGMEFTLGNDATPGDAALFHALSATSVESYVTWASVEPKENQWDWSRWDKQVAALKAAHLKWVPFLIAGPAYATPLWFHNSPHAHYFRCLEHGAESKVQSIFNPDLPTYVERFLRAFAERYADSGVIESVLLGVTGIYGESIYPAGPEGGWTSQLTGRYHNHGGWWAGDSFAEAAFRAAMAKKYAQPAALNQAWGTSYPSYAEVRPFLPDRAPNERARVDMVEWYEQSMTDWAARWVGMARKLMPKTEIYLCTGGDGNPQLGADFTAQAKAIAGAGAGIRITNEGSDYAHNFTVTREVATATRLYGTFCGFEPASQVNEKGVVARIYNAAASGARQLHDYTPNMMTNPKALQNFRAFAAWLTPRRPQVAVALYLSRETWELEPKRLASLYDLSRSLRDLTDHAFVTSRSVQDGALKNCRALVLAESPVLDPAAARAIEQWVREGGLLIGAARAGEMVGGRLHDESAWRGALFQPGLAPADLLRQEVAGPPPPHWKLAIGAQGDDGWLFGQWHGPERGGEWRTVPNAQKRWTSGIAGIYLPTTPGAEYRLKISCFVPPYAIAKALGEVRVNGHTVGKLENSGLQDLSIPLPTALLGEASPARLELVTGTWKPSDHQQADTRDLGLAVREVELIRAGDEETLPAKAMLRLSLDRARFTQATRQVGEGWTVMLSSAGDSPAALANVLAPLLTDTRTYFPGLDSLAPADGLIDGHYATRVEDKWIWLDAKEGAIK